MESVYQEILGRLQRGQIGHQDRVLDYEIAREFECTRMPVRQALLASGQRRLSGRHHARFRHTRADRAGRT